MQRCQSGDRAIKLLLGPLLRNVTWDLALGTVCVIRSLTNNMDWARLKVYGEQRQPIIHKLSSEEKMIQVEKIPDEQYRYLSFRKCWRMLTVNTPMRTTQSGGRNAVSVLIMSGQKVTRYGGLGGRWTLPP